MPANDRQPPAATPPQLPNIVEDAAAPFSSLFGGSFNQAAVESAAQLADSSIFITSSGSRFRLQRIPEPAGERRSPQLSTAGWGGSRPDSVASGVSGGSGASGASAPSRASPVPPAGPAPEPGHLRPQPRPRQQHEQQQPIPPPQPPPPLQHARAFAIPTAVPIQGGEFSPSPSRSSLVSSSQSQGTPGSGRALWEPQQQYQQQPQTVVDTEELPRMMANLSGFGASALYLHSDGGVQAAETLTDSASAGRLQYGEAGGTRCHSGPGQFSMSGGIVDETATGHVQRRASLAHELPRETPQQQLPQQWPAYHQQHLQPSILQGYSFPYPSHPHIENPYGSNRPFISTLSHDGSVPPHTVVSVSSTPALTSPDPFSPPAYGSPHDVGLPPVLTHHGFPVTGFSSYPPEKPGMTPRSQSLPSLMEESSPVFFAPQSRGAAPTSLPASARVGVVSPAHNLGDYNGIDTLTPIFVRVHSPPSSRAATAVAADSSSATRDNVLPGEDVLYDGFVKSSHAIGGPFEEGHLKVFRNNLTHDLRFHCKAGNNTDTHWMKGTKAQMVPVYAYDQRSNHLVFIRDNDGEKKYGSASAQPVLNGPSAIYQFAQLQDLFKFQSQLTGESVVLDISSVKWIRLARANSRSSEMYSSVRLQIWHEPRSRKTMQSDQASFVTAGTALSGPLRERTIPNLSRLMVFLGRSEEYITALITDDIEMEPRGQMSVRLKPRKYSGIHKKNSRAGIKARLEQKSGNDPAGLSIHGEPFNVDSEQYFDEYKTFEIEFESSPSQVNFVQAWNEVIDERRKQRARLARIQEDMRKETFSPKEALSIKT